MWVELAEPVKIGDTGDSRVLSLVVMVQAECQTFPHFVDKCPVIKKFSIIGPDIRTSGQFHRSS